MKGMTILQKLHILRPPKQSDVEWDRRFNADVLEHIFGHLVDERDRHRTRVVYIRETFQPTMLRLSLVSKAWHSVASVFLYSEIYLSSSKAMEILADALDRNSDLRPLVHQFHFTSKVFASGHAQWPYTLGDIHNNARIHGLCPNLVAVIWGRPNKKYPLEQDDDTNLRAIGLKAENVSRLTYMRISIPHQALFGGKMMFTPSVEFPALQALYIVCSKYAYDMKKSRDEPQWFQMPQLRRLTLQDFEVRSGQKLTFPKSRYLHTIEIIGGDLEKVDNFFDRINGPLVPFARTLQTLTITAMGVGNPYFLPSFEQWVQNLKAFGEDDDPWFLSFLENLVELCVPFRSFAKKGIATYPPRLRDLALCGSHLLNYEESELDRQAGRVGVMKIFVSMKCGRPYMPDLKRVRVILRDVDDWYTGEHRRISLPEQVYFKTGVEQYRLRHVGADLLDIGLKTLHVK